MEMINHRRTGNRLQYTFKPEPTCPPSVCKPHEHDPFAQLFDQRADEIVAFVTGTTLVVHNAPVVLAALNAELKRLERPSIESHAKGVIDTCALAEQAYPAQNNSFTALCERLGLDRTPHNDHNHPSTRREAVLLCHLYERLRTDHIAQNLQARLNAATTPNPMNDFASWMACVTSWLPEDARVEITLIQHTNRQTPNHCSYQVRTLDVDLASMPANTFSLKATPHIHRTPS